MENTYHSARWGYPPSDSRQGKIVTKTHPPQKRNEKNELKNQRSLLYIRNVIKKEKIVEHELLTRGDAKSSKVVEASPPSCALFRKGREKENVGFFSAERGKGKKNC